MRPVCAQISEGPLLSGFENMWAHAATQLAEAENIIVIGYSLPKTDQFFPILYALGTVSKSILKRFSVFDPDKGWHSRNTVSQQSQMPPYKVFQLGIRLPRMLRHLK